MRSSTLNIFKALACIGVVFIHCLFTGDAGLFIKGMGRFAVPLFFCISGYYLSSGEEIPMASRLRKLKNTLKLIVIAEAFYGLFNVYYRRLWHPELLSEYLSKYFADGWLIKWMVTGAPPVYAHLWFLYSLAFMYLLVVLFVPRRKVLRYASVSLPVLLVIVALLQEFSGAGLIRNGFTLPFYEGTLYLSNTHLMRVVPFFLMGFVLREFSDRIRDINIPPWLYAGLFVIFEVAAGFEGIMMPDVQFYLGSMLAVASAMCLCIRKPDIRFAPLEYIGANLSTWVYVFHIAFMHLLNYYFPVAIYSGISVWFRPFVVLGASIISSYIFERIYRRITAAVSH